MRHAPRNQLLKYRRYTQNPSMSEIGLFTSSVGPGLRNPLFEGIEIVVLAFILVLTRNRETYC